MTLIEDDIKSIPPERLKLRIDSHVWFTDLTNHLHVFKLVPKDYKYDRISQFIGSKVFYTTIMSIHILSFTSSVSLQLRDE
jgi:hypothetical protein